MGRDVSELTDQLSALHIGPHSRPATRPRTPEPAPSTDGQLEQLQRDLADERATNEDLRLDLETTKVDLADCQETIKKQPPVEDCAARLRDQQARLETKCAQHLAEQKARLMEEVRGAAQVFRAEKEAELAKAVADAKAEKRRMEEEKGRMEEEKGRMEKEGGRMEEVISGLRRDLEATRAKLERQFEASKEADRAIQSLREEKRRLGQTNWELSAANRGLRGTFDQFNQDRQRQSAQTNKAIRSMERAERKVEAIREENRALGAKYAKLDEQYSAAKTRLAQALDGLNRQRIQSQDLTAGLERAEERLAKCEAARKKEADLVRDRARSMDERLKEWEKKEQAAEEAETGEREMDAPLGVPEKAKEGLLGPQAPQWKWFVFWLLVGLLLVLALLAASAAQKRRQVVLGFCFFLRGIRSGSWTLFLFFLFFLYALR